MARQREVSGSVLESAARAPRIQEMGESPAGQTRPTQIDGKDSIGRRKKECQEEKRDSVLPTFGYEWNFRESA